MRRWIGAVAATVVIFHWTAAWAAGGASSGEFLRLGVGARAPSIGDAMTAGAVGPLALHYNPAGLGWTSKSEFDFMYQEMIQGIGHGTMGFAMPIGRASGFGVGLTYLDYGTENRTTISTVGGISAVNAGTFSGQDLAVALSYGSRIGPVAWGLTAKGISSRIAEVDAGAFAVDAGMVWRSRSTPFRLGLAVKNVGTELRYDRQRESLPLLFRGGVGYTLLDGALGLHLDIEKTRAEAAYILGGAEYWVTPSIALRAGYDGRLGGVGGGLTAGAGFRVQSFHVDYGYTHFGIGSETHRIGMRYEFGPAREDEPIRR
jgi:hypothetical protein